MEVLQITAGIRTHVEKAALCVVFVSRFSSSRTNAGVGCAALDLIDPFDVSAVAVALATGIHRSGLTRLMVEIGTTRCLMSSTCCIRSTHLACLFCLALSHFRASM